MRVIIRLYRQYDLDLITLAHYSDFSFPRIAKSCVRSCAAGKAYRVDLPEGRFTPINSMKTMYMYNFILNENVDVDANAIKMLRKVRDRHRNSFVKNLVRGYLKAPALRAYFSDPAYIANEKIFDAYDSETLVKPFEKEKSETSKDVVRTEAKRAPKKRKKAVDALNEPLLKTNEEDEEFLDNLTKESHERSPIPTPAFIYSPDSENKEFSSGETILESDTSEETAEFFDAVSNMISATR